MKNATPLIAAFHWLKPIGNFRARKSAGAIGMNQLPGQSKVEKNEEGIWRRKWKIFGTNASFHSSWADHMASVYVHWPKFCANHKSEVFWGFLQCLVF
jgi:hypothetical protein